MTGVWVPQPAAKTMRFLMVRCSDSHPCSRRNGRRGLFDGEPGEPLLLPQHPLLLRRGSRVALPIFSAWAAVLAGFGRIFVGVLDGWFLYEAMRALFGSRVKGLHLKTWVICFLENPFTFRHVVWGNDMTQTYPIGWVSRPPPLI